MDTERYAKNKQFDRILLDAPCSATGVIRRHPDIKVLRRESDIATVKPTARGECWMLYGIKLKPAGMMLYATCSILPEENEQQIEAFIKRTEHVECVSIPKAQGFGRQVFPGEGSKDGFYYCLLKRKALN